jgi:hypothetical protein
MLDAIGLGVGNSSARKAADAIKDGNKQAIGTIGDYYDKGSQAFQPYLDYGQGMGGLAGLARFDAGDNSGWNNSAEYTGARDAGLYAMDHSASARGRLNSGGYAMDAAAGIAGIANRYQGQYLNRLQWGAGLGQQSAQGLAGLAANAGRSIADLQHDTGLAMAGKQSAYGNNANNFLSSITDKAGQFFGFGG